MIGVGTTAMGLVVWERDFAQLQIPGKGIYSQESLSEGKCMENY